MSTLITGSILLYCGALQSNKEFLIEIVRDTDSGLSTSKSITTQHGPAGSLRPGKNYGQFTTKALKKLVNSKLAKSYEITRVNGKPFVVGDADEAIRLIENGNDWNATKTSQPTLMIKPRNVEVTFNSGQAVPIW